MLLQNTNLISNINKTCIDKDKYNIADSNDETNGKTTNLWRTQSLNMHEDSTLNILLLVNQSRVTSTFQCIDIAAAEQNAFGSKYISYVLNTSMEICKLVNISCNNTFVFGAPDHAFVGIVKYLPLNKKIDYFCEFPIASLASAIGMKVKYNIYFNIYFFARIRKL